MPRKIETLEDLSVGNMSKTERCQNWRIQLEAQAGSGISIRKFCQIHSINVHTFHFWRRKFKVEEAQKSDSKQPNTAVIPFTQLKVVSDEILTMARSLESRDSTILKLPGGATLQLDEKTNLALTAKLLLALRGL